MEINQTILRRKLFLEEEVGLIRNQTTKDIVEAARLIKKGKIYDLSVDRYKGMPLPPMHPPIEVITYRTPKGMSNQGDQAWLEGESNKDGFSFTTEIVFTCLHTGTHLDTLAHANIGDDHHWFAGFTAEKDLGDYGVLHADASTLPPIFTRGVLLDIPKYRNLKVLPAHSGISVQDIEGSCNEEGVKIQTGDVVLIRTGYMSNWPNTDKLSEIEGSGLTLESAKLLAEKQIYAVGADNGAVEQLPTANMNNPHPVHSYLLINKGIYLIEMLDLEKLADDKCYEFLFIGLPVRFRGGTAALMDPIAIN